MGTLFTHYLLFSGFFFGLSLAFADLFTNECNIRFQVMYKCCIII